MPRSKIAVLYMGGSIGMVRNVKTNRIEPMESLDEIHKHLQDVQKEAALKFFSLDDVGSSEITPSHWEKIARTIVEHESAFDGFVVIQGTNTMSYTAAALSFALQGLGKPVILTGSVMPINELGSDGRLNLIFAIQAAQLDIAEVCIVLGPRILRGNRATKVDQSIFQTFDTPSLPPLGEFDIKPHLQEWRFKRRKRSLEPRISFDPNVITVTLQPGLPSAYFDAVLHSKPHGIILRAYGPGMLPASLHPWLQKLTEEGIPIVITSQLLRGVIDLHRYRKQLTLEKLGVISGKNMTTECAVVKLMWALTQKLTPTRLQDLMERSLVGELDE